MLSTGDVQERSVSRLNYDLPLRFPVHTALLTFVTLGHKDHRPTNCLRMAHLS